MGKNRSFKDDPALAEELDSIPKNERSTVIRMALRQYFGIKLQKAEQKGGLQGGKQSGGGVKG